MFFGAGATPSVIHAAGAPGGGTSASPNALVVLVYRKARTPARTAASSRFSVPVMLVSTNACRLWVATCGLCSVAAWMTALTPSMQRSTRARSVIDPTTSVHGEARRSTLRTACPASRSVRTIASPRCPEEPVTRMVPGFALRAPPGAISEVLPDIGEHPTR
jgi:hypothetical protein